MGRRGLRAGRGAFIEALAAALEEQRLSIAMAGIRDAEPARALATVDRWIAAMLPHARPQ